MQEHPSSRLTTAFTAFTLLASTAAHAAPFYWDNDGATPGFGTATGTWTTPTTGDATQGWSPDNTGATLPVDVTTAHGDTAHFGTDTTGLGSGTINIVGPVDVTNVRFGKATGGITLSGGTINFVAGGTSSFQAPSGGGTSSATHTIDSDIAKASGTLRFGTQSTNDENYIVNGIISGGISLDIREKNNQAYLALNGVNTFTGNVNIVTGQTNVNTLADSSAASSLGSGGAINMGGGGGQAPMLWYTGLTATSTNKTINSRSTNETRIVAQDGPLDLTGILKGGSGANSTYKFNFAGTADSGMNTVSGTIQDGSAKTINVSVQSTAPQEGSAESGTWELSGNNTYTGTTTVTNSSILRVGNSNALGFGGLALNKSGTVTVVSGSTLDLAGTSEVNKPIVLNGSGVSGDGALINSGAAASLGTGISAATVPNTGTGTGFSSAPAVVISGTGSGATAVVSSLGLDSASFTILSGTTTYSVAPDVTITGGGGSGATATADLDGGGLVTGITITNAGTGYSSAPNIAFADGTVLVAGTDPTGTGNDTNFSVVGITMTDPGTGYTGTPTFTFDGNPFPATAVLSSVNLNTATAGIGGTGDITIGAEVLGTGGLGKVGANTLVLSGANTYAGTTSINEGILQADGVDVAATSGALGNGGDIEFGGGTLQYTANSAGTDYSDRIVNSTSPMTFDTNGEDVTFATNFAGSNTGGLIKEGAGRLTAKYSNDNWSGLTVANGGTLHILKDSGSNTWTAGNFEINNGATLEIDATVTAVFSARTWTFDNTGGGTFDLDGNTIFQSLTNTIVTTGGPKNFVTGDRYNMQNTNQINYSVADGSDAVDLEVSVRHDRGSIGKTGAGTVSLTNSTNNLLVGNSIIIDGGVLELSAGGRINNGSWAGPMANNGIFRHNGTSNQTLAGIIDGTGSVELSGGATLTLSASNTYTGDTTVSDGTLSLGDGSSSSALAIGADLIIDSGAVVNLNFVGTDSVDQLILDGVPQATGTWGATGSGATFIDDIYFTGTGTINVTNGDDPFSDWATLTGATNDPEANDDPDTLNNLLEFAFGTDPLVADAVPLDVSGPTAGTPTTSITYGPLDFNAQFVQRTDGSAAYTVQFSNDLSTWEDSAEVPTLVTAIDADYEIVEVNYPIILANGKKANFFRVSVELN